MMTIDPKALSNLSTTVVTLIVFSGALFLWNEQAKYNAETERMNRDRMSKVIMESLEASREDRRQLTELSRGMLDKLRENERSEAAILAALQEIIGLIKKDRVEIKSEIQGIMDQLEAQTRSVTREMRK